MAHELAGALQQTGRVRQRRAVKEANVYVGGEHVDVGEGRVSQTGDRTAVMQKLADFVAAISHHVKPVTRDGSQFAGVVFQPGVDGGIALDSAVESKQIRFHHRSGLSFRELVFAGLACLAYTRRPSGVKTAERGRLLRRG